MPMQLDPSIILNSDHDRIVLGQRELDQRKREGDARIAVDQQEAELRRQEILARREEIIQRALERNQPKEWDPNKANQALTYQQNVGKEVYKHLVAAKEQPEAWRLIRADIGRLAGPEAIADLPEAWDDQTSALVDSHIASYKSYADQAQQQKVGVHVINGRLVDDAGKVIYESPDKPAGDVDLSKSGLDVQAAAALASGDMDTYNRLLKVKKEMGQADDRPRVTINAGGIGANIPGDFDKTGEDFLKTVPAQWRSTVKKIANYDEDPTKVASMRGGLRETLMAWVNQVNPAYDQSQFALRSPARKAFTIGTQGQQINSINTAIGHIDQLTTLAADLQNGGFVPANKAWNTIRTAFGSDKVTNFDTLKDALAGEVDSVLSKSGATVSGIAAAKEKIHAANSPTQLAGYVKTLIPVMGSKLAELNYQFHQAMGADDPYSALSPQSKAILTKHGFDPEKPEIGAGGAPRPAAPAAAGRVRVVGPEGQTGTVPAGTTLPPGWRKQ